MSSDRESIDIHLLTEQFRELHRVFAETARTLLQRILDLEEELVRVRAVAHDPISVLYCADCHQHLPRGRFEGHECGRRA